MAPAMAREARNLLLVWGAVPVTLVVFAFVLMPGQDAHHRIALLAPYTGAEDLRAPVNPYLFHVRASYANETERIVTQLQQIGVSRVAFFYQDDGLGKTLLGEVKKATTAAGLTLLAEIKAAFAPPAYRNAPVDAYEDFRKADPVFRAWADTNLSAHRTDQYAIVTISLKAHGETPGDATADHQKDALAAHHGSTGRLDSLSLSCARPAQVLLGFETHRLFDFDCQLRNCKRSGAAGHGL